MDRILNFEVNSLAQQLLGGGGANEHAFDTGEQIHISSLASLKMLKHGRAGIPMEVVGLMLGEFVDNYTVSVVDVFAMPQSGSSVTVESVDPAFQAKMLEMLRATGRPEMVVGWYHSHPGFGCWLSGVDIQTQRSFEALGKRVVAVVIDPIQSVKGKVIIDAFRLINQMAILIDQEPRHVTSNLGHLNKPSIKAIQHGLNRHYYSISINFRKSELEQMMLLKVQSKHWSDMLAMGSFAKRCSANVDDLQSIHQLAKNYHKALEEEDKLTKKELMLKNVGKQDPKRHLEGKVEHILTENVITGVCAALSTVVFK